MATSPEHPSEASPLKLSNRQAEAIDTYIAGHGTIEARTRRAILCLAGLFHRPASKSAIDALLTTPAIDHLTGDIPEHLITPPPTLVSRLLMLPAWQARKAAPPVTMSREDAGALWQSAIQSLRDEGLLKPESPSIPGGIDAPEGVRDYIADHLRLTAMPAWQSGHVRLFRYYQGLLPKLQPTTLAEMEPLYAAIVHGCAAGVHQEAFDRVYTERMLHRHTMYLGKTLGAYDAWLEVLRHFFAEPWTRPHPSLNPECQRNALAQAGFALRAAGRLREATHPIAAAIEMSIAQENWLAASAEAQNLSEIQSTLGELQDSIVIARDSVRFAQRTKDSLRRLSSRARLGDALHQYGEIRLAARNFRRAERWQREARPDLPILISLRHYNYADLLLAMGRHDEVRVRGLWTLEVSRDFQGMGMGPLDIALDKLTIARAAHAQWREAKGLANAVYTPHPTNDEDGDPDAQPGDEDKTTTDTLPAAMPSVPVIKQQAIDENRNSTDHHDVAMRAYDQSVEELRRDGIQYLPAALIARATYHRDNKDFAAAKSDLDEAENVASPGGMRLYLTDIALERMRLALAEDPIISSEEKRSAVNALWLKARELIQTCSYHRRDSELEDLKILLKALPPLA